MTKAKIHPNAVVEPGAQIGDDVVIEPFAVVKEHVVLEKGVVVKSHAYIDGYTTVGEGTTIYPGAIIGAKTQDLKYRGEKTYVKIGRQCDIRECVTINASCGEGTAVQIGDKCLIMAYCHIAHNCTIGNRVIMGNNATLAGHVLVEDCAIVSALTPVHQFSRIGCYAMVGGMSRVTHDIPPYTIGAGIPFKFGGLNIIGLKRHGFPLKTRQELAKAFKLLYRSQLRYEEALNQIEREVEPLSEVIHFVKFCRASKRGLIGLQGVSRLDEEIEQKEDEEELSIPASS